VPYRFWKEFPGQVRLSYPRKYAGPRTYKMYARDLTLDPQVSSLPVQRELERRGQWASRKLNFGHVAVCRFVDFIQAAEDLLRADPWALVQAPPRPN
jgi:hypothetical protein